MNIGMIGIGLMGHGIATNLQKRGHRLSVLEHPGNRPLDDLIAGGATTHATAREVAARSDVVIVCVTGTPQVEAVVLGVGGALEGLRSDGIVIDCSTAIPASTERVAQAVREAGGRFLDAPMTRTPKEAAEGRLNLLVGGDRDVFEQCLPLLRCFAENIVYVGPVGAGHRMKLLHNYVSLGSLALLSEAAACALRAGVAPDVFVEVLANGGGGGTALERLKPYLLSSDPSALRFAMSNAQKDLGYYSSMADDGGAVHGIADAVLRTFADAVEQAGPERWVPELVSLLVQRGAAVGAGTAT
ncbi:MAG TPA: NAD(P)-dependent oxidoreductase [Casimicrobiaceae bacterium]|jgi:3-hydroxyisobutyrate dehydrogenase-like beta-hydroxyacid dehydrogenase